MIQSLPVQSCNIEAFPQALSIYMKFAASRAMILWCSSLMSSIVCTRHSRRSSAAQPSSKLIGSR
jgi:hypothetical protein